MIYLDSTNIIQTLDNATWAKTMYMHYDYCLNVWVLKQNFGPFGKDGTPINETTDVSTANCTTGVDVEFPEKCVFAEITDK